MTYLDPITAVDVLKPVQEILASRVGECLDPAKLTGVNQILKIWEDSKALLRKSSLFNGSSIVEIANINIALTDAQKRDLYGTFVHALSENFGDMFPDYYEYVDYAAELSIFLTENYQGFFENKTVKSFRAPDGTYIAENSKISKSIKYFFEDKVLVRALQDKYSELIQQDKICGTLCASIHPLDFLSSSENNYGWRSCHALNGDYAAGNLSYMMDQCTVMFYLKGADEVKLPRFPDSVPWNDKKWRMLVCIDPERRFAFAGRQYPFFNGDLLDMVGDYLHTGNFMIHTGWQHDYIDEYEGYSLSHSYILTRRNDLVCREMIIKNAAFSNHYNDWLYSTMYVPHYLFNIKRTLTPEYLNPVEVGHCGVCACCGNETGLSSDRFVCDECDIKLNPMICECCGKVIDTIYEETYWLYGYGELCRDCYLQHTRVCPTCGKRNSDKTNRCLSCDLKIVDGKIVDVNAPDSYEFTLDDLNDYVLIDPAQVVLDTTNINLTYEEGDVNNG